jgi:hypothetical protein
VAAAQKCYGECKQVRTSKSRFTLLEDVTRPASVIGAEYLPRYGVYRVSRANRFSSIRRLVFLRGAWSKKIAGIISQRHMWYLLIRTRWVPGRKTNVTLEGVRSVRYLAISGLCRYRLELELWKPGVLREVPRRGRHTMVMRTKLTRKVHREGLNRVIRERWASLAALRTEA